MGSFCIAQKLSSVLCDDLEVWDGGVGGIEGFVDWGYGVEKG